ncbi:LacI family DNA-binding transcriptional regulator [Paenibacillus abyssi]|uniref:LacI family transcriptional regulator n=1 Tax=Paenibacillus abyssi TaxID=1340531 RepID=A0A917G095_9BACL|nr:LacI family DNA-binding transcriptional regulator [Paenibacillus abyssi]GGG16201.1 LacI family transcriptional regulator [Paenibacillus abyssi]
MKATIYDVAREAGVSIAAVSQVINGKGKISEERRQEILQVMERLNYRPSVIAAALTGKKTYTIGLLVPDISNPFFSEIARAVEDQGDHRGYSIIMCSTDNKMERAERYLSLMLQKSVDGLIIGTGMENKEALIKLMKSIPVVMVAREAETNLAMQTVIVDDFVGGSLAARHFLELKHSRVAVLAEKATVSSSRERIRGFRETLVQAGHALAESRIKACEDDLLKEGKEKALELLQQPDRPSAIFCCNDLLAIGTLRAAKELGLRVPHDVSIIGFDNTILATVTDPTLTTVAQPTELMGKMAVDSLIQKLEGQPPAEERVVLRPELIIRQSTAVKE